MKRIRRKIVLASCAVLMLLLTTVSTTFAWFSLNESAWLEGMELEVNNMDNLLITSDYDTDTAKMKFKQYLTAEDIVAAINQKRDDSNKITGLSDIKLAPVTTTNGVDFSQTVVSYDAMNKQTLGFETADLNSYISMRISFIVENNGTEKPDFDLVFAIEEDDVTDIAKTTFAAKDQTITLVNDLVNGDTPMKPEENLVVNPVNALRMAVTNISDNVVHIYNIGKSTKTNANAGKNLGDLADAANADKNAMFTYYNNINNADLPVMGDMDSSVVQHDELDQVLGTFTTVTDTQYTVVTLDIVIWIEGYDADSIIGLDTTAITMLLTFGADKK